MAVNKSQANVEIRKKQVSELEDENEAVRYYIEGDNRSGSDQINLQTLKDWQTRARKLVIDVKINAAQKSFFGLCPNPESPDQISKQAVRSSKDIAELVQEARRFNIPLSYYLKNSVTQGFENFESRKDVFKEILETLQFGSVNKIGVHGPPGVGKTMLVREVKRKAEQEKLFDVVVMATVGRNPDFPRIQDEIARGLGLDCVCSELTSQNQEASDRIKPRLTEREALVILDDIWAPGLDLQELGIPLGVGQKQHRQEKKKKDSLSCKILLTSRHLNLLSDLIGNENNFAIKPLREEEAWKLFTKAAEFKMIAVEPAESRSLQFYGRQIAKGCEGLPISIALLANGLKSRPLVDWNAALRNLQSPSQENLLGIPKGLYLAVELTYGGLESKKLQQTFLLCSLMGHNATIKDLLKYGIGLGLFPGIESRKEAQNKATMEEAENKATMEEARNEALTLLSKLKNSFLLLDGDSNVQFDMHDFVRIVAIQIASQDHSMLASGDEDAPIASQHNKAIMEKLKWIYSSNFNASGYQLPDKLKCPQLTLFHLSNGVLAIPPNLFREAEEPKVLRLDQSELEFVHVRSILGKLKNLRVLSLVGCDIQELPEEVGKLTRLKFLDLSDCTKLKVIPPGVLSSLSRLEELYLGNSFAKWDYSEEQQNRRNASLVELTQLENLTTLEVSVCDIQMFAKVLFNTELKRFKIFIGDVWHYWDSSFENSKILKLKLDASIHFDYSVRELLKKTDELHLEVLNGIKDMVNELDDDGFQQLKYLHVKNYPEIQYLFIDSKKGIGGKIFPNLEVLVLQSSMTLEKIFHSQFVPYFNKLRIIYVEHCNQLKNLFSFSIAKQLLHLQEITVADCRNIVEIVDDEEQGSTNVIPIRTNVSTTGTNVLMLAKLQCLRLQNLPEFISFSHEDDTSPRLTSLFNEKVAFPNLKRMTISHLENSRMLWQELFENSFSNLRSLRVTYCQNLSTIFPSDNNMLRKLFKSLEKLEIIGCSSLNEIKILSSIRKLVLDSLENLRDIFSRDSSSVLQILKVWRCDSLTCLSTSKLASFKNLTTLNVQGCHLMKTLVSVRAAQSLGQLVRMTVRECRILNKIVESDNLGREDSIINFSKLRSLKLECLSRLESFCSGNFKLEFPVLEKVVVDQCPKLKVFSEGHVNTRILHRVELTERADKWCWFGDLNTTTQRMCTEKVGFVGLKDLILQDFPELIKIWQIRSSQEILDFRRLECLYLYDCNNFRSLLTPSMVFCLVQLRSIMVKSCVMLEQVIMGNGEEGKMIFPQLWLIRLESCSDLTTFYAGSYGLKIPALANIIVNDCPKMLTFAASPSSHEASHYFFSSKVALPRLQQLRIKSMESLNKIWDNQHDAYSWRLLNSIIVEACEKLLNIFPFSILKRLQKLEKLEIRNCDSLEEIFEFQELGSSQSQAQITTQPTSLETAIKFVFPKLTHLNLFKLPKLNCFCHSMHITEWPSLKKLEVYECQVQIFASEFPSIRGTNGNNRLKIWTESPLFWVSKATFSNLKELKLIENKFMKEIWRGQNPGYYLPNLEKLEIRNGNLLEEIIECQELGVTTQATLMETVTKFVFPKLMHLDLYKLPKLKCFCRQMHTIEWPSLKKLRVYGCDLQIFATESPDLRGAKEKNQLEIDEAQYPLFWVSKATFPNLRELKLEADKFMEEIWRGQRGKNPGYYFPKLKALKLKNLQEPSPAAISPLFIQSLPNLEKLVVKNSSFNEIFPRQSLGIRTGTTPRSELMLFGNLQTLEVFQCHRLQNLVRHPATENLVQLKTMSIIECNMIEYILILWNRGSNSDVKDVIVFTKLKHLHLRDLPILNGFCLGECNFQFPSLEDVFVSNCLQLRTFTEGDVRAANLQKVKFEDNKERWAGDLKTTIQVYWENEKSSLPRDIFRPQPRIKGFRNMPPCRLTPFRDDANQVYKIKISWSESN